MVPGVGYLSIGWINRAMAAAMMASSSTAIHDLSMSCLSDQSVSAGPQRGHQRRTRGCLFCGLLWRLALATASCWIPPARSSCFAAGPLTASRCAASLSLQGASPKLLQCYCGANPPLLHETHKRPRVSLALIGRARPNVSTPPGRPIVTSRCKRNALLDRDIVVFCSPILCFLCLGLRHA